MTERNQNNELNKNNKISSKNLDNKDVSTQKIDNKNEVKKNKVVAEKIVKNKKTEVVVNGRDLGISTKHAIAVCNFIRSKNIDDAIKDLGEVKNMKRAIKMKGEIPHRKGMMSGRYPVNAVKEFLILLKSLKANAINHELEFEKAKLFCMANVAPRPMKRFGQGKVKRSHVQIKLIPITK